MEYRKLGRTGLDVSTVGLGMEHLAPQQIAPVVRTAVDRGGNHIDLMIWESERKEAFGAALGAFQQDARGQCVYCNHCLPCPSVIDIASITRILAGSQYGVTDQLRAAYDILPVRASDCIECRDCMERCPFGVDIIGKMQQAATLFG